MRQPPEKLATGIAVARFREAESGEQRRRARACAVAADRLEAMVQLRERAPSCAVVALRRASAASTSRSSRVAVEHEVDRAASPPAASPARRARSSTDARQLDAAGVRAGARRQDRGEQARLAAAVGADEADLVAGVHGEARAFEQAPRAAGESKVDGA